MRRIVLMLVVAAALLTATVAPAVPAYADGGCWLCNSAG
jgi:hypothetical protein